MTSKGSTKGSIMAHNPLADLNPTDGPETAAADKNAALDLGDALTIAEVGETHERLRETLDLGALRLEAGELEQLDAAGVQLLCAAVIEARRQQMEVEWAGVSPRLREAAERLGVQETLAL